MKQILFCSRLADDLAAPGRDGRCPVGLDSRIRAARTRHSARGVSSLLVHHGDSLLGVLEGGAIYVERMLSALVHDAWFSEPTILAERPIRQREYSQLALRLIETASLLPPPNWTRNSLAAIDIRTARRILGGLRATHGLHTPPVRESFLHTVQVGRLKAH